MLCCNILLNLSHILLSIVVYDLFSLNFITTFSLLSSSYFYIFFFYISYFAGYGNKTPTTELGKITTIFYAIIGMPLFLLYLSNIGNLSPFTYLYIYLNLFLWIWWPQHNCSHISIASREGGLNGDLSFDFWSMYMSCFGVIECFTN